MLRRFFRKLTKQLPARRPGHRFAVEALESRAVLSICGVTCGLTDGMLTVQGTAGDDDIAIRFDASSTSISVIGRNQELIGQYSLNGIRALNVEGLAGNDQFEIDPRLHVNIQLNGGEGEDALVGAGTHVHDPGTASTFQQLSVERSLPFTTNSLLFGGNGTTSSATQLSSSLLNGSALPLQLTQSAFFAADHSAHSSGSGDYLLSGLANHMHDGASMAGVVSAGVLVHSHAASSRGLSSPGSTTTDSTTLDSHDQHAGNNGVTASPTKLVNKACTVSYTQGLVVTAVDGKRECDCEEKKAAADAIAKQLNEGGAPFAGSLKLAIADCLPCQRSLLAGLPAELQTCALTPADAIDSALAELEIHGNACPDRASVARETDTTASTWMDGVKFVGWSLLTASVILAPTLWNNEDDEEEADKRAEPTDWFFGRLGAELLSERI